jgi:hypothetical protein
VIETRNDPRWSRRARELDAKWRKRERFTNEEMEEALVLRVGINYAPRIPAEDDPRYPRFLLLWNRCARFETAELSKEDIYDAGSFGITIPWPEPSAEEADLYGRRVALVNRRLHGHVWTREDCEEAVACGAASREEVDEYFAFLETIRARGYEPILTGGIECDSVHIRGFPRTSDGGYELPGLLNDVSYRTRGMDFLDMDAPDGKRHVAWIGMHRVTGKLKACMTVPDDTRLAHVSVKDKIRRFFRLPIPADAPAVFKAGRGGFEMDPHATRARYDTPDYVCVWLR